MKRLIAIVLFQVLLLGLATWQIGLANSAGSPGDRLDGPASPYDPYIGVTPALPTVHDTINVTVGGEWPDSCVPTYQSHRVASQTIQVEVVLAPITTMCFQVVSSWKFTVGVGALPAGSYQVDLYRAYRPYTQTLVLWASKSFHVAEQWYSTYLPVVTR